MWWFCLAGSLAGVVLGETGLGGKRSRQRGVRVDPARCRSTVIDIRLQVRETLSELRPGSSGSANALLEMHRACDAYLRATERPGGSVEARLRDLRLVLNQGARRLSSGRHVQYLAPGERAAVRREMLLAAARAKTEARRNPGPVSRPHTDSPAPVPGPRRAALLESDRRSAEASAHARAARRLVDHSDARIPL